MQVSTSPSADYVDSPSLMKRPNRDDTSLYGLTNLLSQLQKEYKLSARIGTTSTEIIKGQTNPESKVHTLLSPTLRPSVKARGLPLFDRGTHLVNRLLFLLLLFDRELRNFRLC